MNSGRASLAFILLVGIMAPLLVPAAAHAQPVVPLFNYYIWGQVRSPGAKQLGPNPDLLELISVAGGPADGANLRKVELIRAAGRERVKIDVDRMVRDGDIIPLQPGDIVIIPRTGWYKFRDNLWLVGGTASVLNLGLMLYSLLR